MDWGSRWAAFAADLTYLQGCVGAWRRESCWLQNWFSGFETDLSLSIGKLLGPFENNNSDQMSPSSFCCFPLIHFCVSSLFSSLCASFSPSVSLCSGETAVVKASHGAWPSNWETYHSPIQSLQEVRGHKFLQCPSRRLSPLCIFHCTPAEVFILWYA